MSRNKGILYIVATPIGNLGDFSFRAIEVLKSVDLIASEDTRHSRHLLNHYGISNALTSLHEHNELTKSETLLDRLIEGESIAIISDAGTPLISDPGFPMVRLARNSGIKIVPIPGPCALIAALSASGLPTDRFRFEGFPPRNQSARKTLFQKLLDSRETLIFYESSHRIGRCLEDLQDIFPPERKITVVRELTKTFETIVYSTMGDILQGKNTDPIILKGEFVVLVEGNSASEKNDTITLEHERILRILLKECSLKQAVRLCSEVTGVRKKSLYKRALEIEDTKVTDA